MTAAVHTGLIRTQHAAHNITYLRHPRGRGLLLADAEVSLSSFLSRDSVAAGACQIRDSRIANKSVIDGCARIFGGDLSRTYAGGSIVVAGEPEVQNSILTGKSITGLPYLDFVITKDSAEIADQAYLIGKSIAEPIIIEGAACVYGKAILVGSFVVGGKIRICDGLWARRPRHVDLGYAAITESALGALVDCRNRTVDYWLRHGANLGRRWEFSDAQVCEMLDAVRFVGHNNSQPHA